MFFIGVNWCFYKSDSLFKIDLFIRKARYNYNLLINKRVVNKRTNLGKIYLDDT